MSLRIPVPLLLPLIALLGGATLFAAAPLESVTFRLAEPAVAEAGKTPAKNERVIQGKVEVEAGDGGILLLGRDGRLWNIEPADILKREKTGRDFTPASGDELARSLVEEFGPGYQIVRTKHYVLCTNGDAAYAQWCGGLFERLLTAFLAQWRAKPLEAKTPEAPLVAIVFATQADFAKYATLDGGPDLATSPGYFSIRTNRIVLYDLTGEDPGGKRAAAPARSTRSAADVARRIEAAPLRVATVVHEATHQIAFNSGLHTRYADNPLWLTEGMAMYFESPDLGNRTGWRTAGRVNSLRIRQFHDYASRRPVNSLVSLLGSDRRLSEPETAADAYAEAWALTWFLCRTRRQAYVTYLARISQKKVLNWDTPAQRVQDFQACFGNDLQKLDRDFVRYMSNVGRR